MELQEFKDKVTALWYAHEQTINATSSKRAKWINQIIEYLWDKDFDGAGSYRLIIYKALKKLLSRVIHAVTPAHRAIWYPQPVGSKHVWRIGNFMGIIFRPLNEHGKRLPGTTMKSESCSDRELVHTERIYRRSYHDELFSYTHEDPNTKLPQFVENKDAQVLRIDVELTRNDEEANEDIMARLVNKICKSGKWEFLGLKDKSSGDPTAVFLKVPEKKRGTANAFWWAIRETWGKNILIEVAEKCEMKSAQNMAIIACRQGFLAKRNVNIHVPKLKVHKGNGANVDGVMLWLDSHASDELREAHKMPRAQFGAIPKNAKMIAGTIIFKDVVITKGTIMLDMPYSVAFEESVKFGKWDGVTQIPASAFLIGEIDALNRSGRVLNNDQDTEHDQKTFDPRELENSDYHRYQNTDGKVIMVRYSPAQELPYNCWTEVQRQRIIKKIILPWVKEQGSPSFMLNLKTLERLVACGIGNINYGHYLNTITPRLLESAVKPKMPGIFALVAPCQFTIRKELGEQDIPPELILAKNEIRVPKGSFAIDDYIDVTRFPCLPIGTATQRYKITGYTEGNFCEVAHEMWTHIQGGDFDGDKARLCKFTVDLFPDLEYPQTLLSELKTDKMVGENRKGLESRVERVKQALIVASRNIGQPDLTARRASEIKITNPEWQEQANEVAQIRYEECRGDRDKALALIAEDLQLLREEVPEFISRLDEKFQVPQDLDLTGLGLTVDGAQPLPFAGEWKTLRYLLSAAIQATIDAAKKEVVMPWLPNEQNSKLIPTRDTETGERIYYYTDHMRDFRKFTGNNIHELLGSPYYDGCKLAIDIIERPLNEIAPYVIDADKAATRFDTMLDESFTDSEIKKKVGEEIWWVVGHIHKMWREICREYANNPTERANQLSLMDEVCKLHFHMCVGKIRTNKAGNKVVFTGLQRDRIKTLLGLAFISRDKHHLLVRLPLDFGELIVPDIVAEVGS